MSKVLWHTMVSADGFIAGPHADPDELRLRRKAERNLGFGEGIHFCLGANLARLQMRVVLDTLLPVIPEFTVSGPVRWMSTPGDRGIESLPVRK